MIQPSFLIWNNEWNIIINQYYSRIKIIIYFSKTQFPKYLEWDINDNTVLRLVDVFSRLQTAKCAVISSKYFTNSVIILSHISAKNCIQIKLFGTHSLQTHAIYFLIFYGYFIRMRAYNKKCKIYVPIVLFYTTNCPVL